MRKHMHRVSFITLVVCLLVWSAPLLAEGPGMAYHHFNVAEADDRITSLEPVAPEKAPHWAEDVTQSTYEWSNGPDMHEPYFQPPMAFVIPPAEGSDEPFYKHNHCPAITWCGNGDLLAVWFSTQREEGLEMTILASRLRAKADAWDPASEFFKADDRNMTGSALLNDGHGRLYHFNGMGPNGVKGWKDLALLMRTSTDNGATWTAPRSIAEGVSYAMRRQVIAGTIMTKDGALFQACDGNPTSEGPTALHVSRDGGQTWRDTGGDIRGIHAGVVELNDGRLMAFGRSQAIDGRMPISISDDMGKTWTYKASEFPPIHGGQRLVLRRLNEGPILLVSFTWNRKGEVPQGMTFLDEKSEPFTGYGLFAALSFDEGETWPVRKLLTPGAGELNGGAWTKSFTTAHDQAEPAGYLTATQTPDGVIHLISSALHYRFNLAWLKEPTRR
jgi:hypothetical protein